MQRSGRGRGRPNFSALVLLAFRRIRLLLLDVLIHGLIMHMQRNCIPPHGYGSFLRLFEKGRLGLRSLEHERVHLCELFMLSQIMPLEKKFASISSICKSDQEDRLLLWTLVAFMRLKF